MKPVDELQSALISTGLVQPVDVKARGGKVEVLCRLVPGQEKPWLMVMDGVLSVVEQLPVGEAHLCRRYVRKGGAMVFGYHIGLDFGTSKNLSTAITVVIDELKKAKPQLTPVVATPVSVAPAPSRRIPLAPGQHPPPRKPQPRAPGAPGGGFGERPEGWDPHIRVVAEKVGEDGSLETVEEMPLPHVYKDLNRPTPKEGQSIRDARGARTLSPKAK